VLGGIRFLSRLFGLISAQGLPGQGQFHAWARGADAAVEDGSLLWVAQPILSLAAGQ